ncbi:unnamed protein product [Wickerhamomyces anomalus]
MSKVAVIGATGKTGSLVVQSLTNAGFDVTGLVRNPAKARTIEQFANINFETFPLESTSVSKIALFLKDFDSVVFAAGVADLSKHTDVIQIELDGAMKIIEACEQAGVKRVVFISSIAASDRDFWYDNDYTRVYYTAKRTIDKVLERSMLDYTIVEPGPLVDEDGTGKIKIPKEAYQSAYEDFDFKENYYALKVPRKDVAKAITLSLKNDKTIRKTLPLVQGDTPIEKVIEDCL